MPARQKKKNNNQPIKKKDGVRVPEKETPPPEEFIDEEERLQILDDILSTNRKRVETEELGEEVDWDLLKKKKRKPNRKHTRKEHILQIAPGIHLTRRQILTIIFQLEFENARLKSIPTARAARACKSIIKTSPKFDQDIHEIDPKFKGSSVNMNKMKMTKAALERVIIHVEKELENIFRWAWILNLTQKKRTLKGQNFITARELMEGKYDINKAANFNEIKRRYGSLSDAEVELENRLADAGLHSIDQIYSILENTDITMPSGNMFIPHRLDMALRDGNVKGKISEKGVEFIARLKQEQEQQKQQQQQQQQQKQSSSKAASASKPTAITKKKKMQ